MSPSVWVTTTQKMKFSIMYFFSKSDQIRRKLRFWSHLLKKSLMENFFFMQILRKETKIFIYKKWSHWKNLSPVNMNLNKLVKLCKLSQWISILECIKPKIFKSFMGNFIHFNIFIYFNFILFLFLIFSYILILFYFYF